MSGWLKIVVLVSLASATVLGLAAPIPDIPGLGQLARIIYFHIPQAWMAVIAFFISMAASIRYLRGRDLLDDRRAASAAELGLVFSLLATVTGSIFARVAWGSFWNWDPRETSIALLVLVYLAYFALRAGVADPERRAALSAVYATIAFVSVPAFVFIAPRVYRSLHPDPLINPSGRIHMGGGMLAVFLFSLASFTLLFVWLYRLRVRVARLALAVERGVMS